MLTCYVIDTNIVISNPQALLELKADELCLPLVVLAELDNHKTRTDHVGKNARIVNRFLDDLRKQGSLEKGVALPDGTIVKVAYSKDRVPEHMFPDMKYDDYIISTALLLKETRDVTLISNDLNVRVRANSCGLKAEGFDGNKENVVEDNSLTEVFVSADDMSQVYTVGTALIDVSSFQYNQHILVKTLNEEVYPNIVCRVNKDKNRIETLRKGAQHGVYNIKPKNLEQSLALDYLLSDDIQLVILEGTPGSGKSLLSMAAGLQKVTEDKKYEKISVVRAVVPVDDGIGYLPGTAEEKMEPWVRPISDTVEFLMGIKSRSAKNAGRSAKELFDMGYIEVSIISYLRGANLDSRFIVIDDAQNMSTHDLKTILTRVSKNSKVVITGDRHQIDNPNLNELNNGLVNIIEKFKNNPLTGCVLLQETHRSPVAKLAASLL